MEEKKKIKIGMLIISIIAVIAVMSLATLLYMNNAKLKKVNSKVSELQGNNKKEITAEEFKNIISTKDFTINLPQEAMNPEAMKKAGIKDGYLTKEIENVEYRVNYFEFKDENSEQYLYYDAINTIRNEDDGNIKETLEKSMNHTKYTALTNGKYMVVSRIGNTLIWGTIDEGQKQKLIDLLNEMGY